MEAIAAKTPMTYSKVGIALTESFEGVRLTAYRDQGGVWTIGYGHTGADVKAGMTCTQGQAEAWLLEDLLWAVDAVNRTVTEPVTQGEFDAMVDLCFNIGCGNFAHSSVVSALAAGNAASAASALLLWDKVHAIVNAGLLRRREAEEVEFNAPSTSDATGHSAQG